MEQQVAWYPGHMAKAARRIAKDLRSIDIVVEMVDARVPLSGRNPLLNDIAARRTHVVAMSRADLANPTVTKAWLLRFAQQGLRAIAVDARTAGSVARVSALLAQTGHAGSRIARAMIVGIPNSGKSSLVNAVLRRAAAKTQARAGVTRQAQWFRLGTKVELMDTPGVLPPKIRGAEAQWKLALCGAVPDDRYDPQEVATRFYDWISKQQPHTRVPDLETFARRRFIGRGGGVDYHNAARSYIAAFNDGKFGRISLESSVDTEAA